MNDKADTGKCIHFDPWRSDVKIRLLSDILETKADVRLRVTGASMAPFVETGSIVTLSRVLEDQLRVGDLILFRCKENTMMLHRLIAFAQKKGCLFDRTVFITKGDGLDSPDLPVSETDYLAKVVRIESKGQDVMKLRDMNKHSSRVFNYFRAKYHWIKSFLLCNYIKLKTRQAVGRKTIESVKSKNQPSDTKSHSNIYL